ncbi:TIGR02679 family protein [Sphaerisporangium sp. NPDC049003]|uniref:TIGR02679 family protein n=1 Tax=Sphaerisporangium sp. NPDC049003 TaxID=3364517 RepID=UPI0037218FEF
MGEPRADSTSGPGSAPGTGRPRPAALEELRGDGWRRVLAAARRRLERMGGALDGSVGLTAPSEAERRVIIGITGTYRPENVKRLTVPLASLDDALTRMHGMGLRQTLARLGDPVRDRHAERAAEDSARQALLASAGTARSAGEGWFAEWLSALTADGTLTRLIRRGDGHLIRQATAVLDRLPATFVPLPVLAASATGDTKALTPGSPLATLVLRALALNSGSPAPPSGRAGQRALWESAGVIVDDLASQVLLLNVRTRGDDVVSRWLNDAAGSGIPFRLTLQQQSAHPVVPTAREIFVCENPAVLRVAAAELGNRSAALVCTEGVPSAACHKLLAAAVAAGSRLRWRADFDWTGLHIVAAAVRDGATPWRMGAADYTAGLALGESTPLIGGPSDSPWDPALAEAMAAEGRAVMEERLIPALCGDLSAPSR